MDVMVTTSKSYFSPLLYSQLKTFPKPSLQPPPPPPPPKVATIAITTFQKAKELHAHIIRTQFQSTNLLPVSPQAQLNLLIASYVKNNAPSSAFKVYAHMRKTGTALDNFTLPSALKACAQLSSIRQGMEIHGFAIKAGFGWDIFIHNSLMQMYSDCELLASAMKLFDEMHERDVVSWSTMIGSYAWCKLFDKAIDLVREMLLSDIRPSEVAIINMLNLFADVGDLRKGRPVHTYLIKNSIQESPSVNASTALIDMYVKCGSVPAARRVFDRMAEKSTATWAAMIAGCIRCNDMGTAMELFIKMRHNNVFSNEITMLSLVIECGSTGNLELGKWLHVYILRHGFKISTVLGTALVDMYCKCRDLRSARAVFDRMDEKGIAVWTAMIAGYAHTNSIKEAFDLFSQMRDANIKPNEITMVNLLSLCSEAGALDRGRIGELAAKELLKLEPHTSGYNILLSNIYAIDRRWNEVAEVRKSMKDTGIRKVPGISSVEVNGVVHEFVMGDASHPQYRQIHAMVLEMQGKLKKAGHVADTSNVFLNIDDEEKETVLSYHSEKLAMAFGLISTSAHTPIRVVKNLRVCDDCHAATKLLSQIYGRVFIVRDRNRFHHFCEGSCSFSLQATPPDFTIVVDDCRRLKQKKIGQKGCFESSEVMNLRRDHRNSRAALFDNIEEGGIRAFYPSHEINEYDNDRAIDGLQDRVDFLKRLTGEIHEEVEIHNRALDKMGHGMDASRGVLSGTVDRFKMVFERKSNRRMLKLVAIFLVLFLLIYYLTK
ncbi:hypothetical protein Cni_G19446 [Canna indica]|uniref:t-SNARE coiled-coil homology domain-containing protein n=1 Tax=Canna indica TaxID=4628 RepID=A0AAQ3KN75_9LILI|nr:hypothetical protein Cni_G19446 [Canna indica]